MSILAEAALAALVVIGGLFGLIGSFGLLKLRDPMQRLHAPTKASTLGVGAVLIASAFEMLRVTGVTGWQDALVALFLFLTAPLTALYLARCHLKAGAGDAPLGQSRTGRR